MSSFFFSYNHYFIVKVIFSFKLYMYILEVVINIYVKMSNLLKINIEKRLNLLEIILSFLTN